MVFLFLLLLIYLLFFAFSILGFFKLNNKTFPSLDSYIVSNLTVIIPFRNEESRIFGLLESIQKQTDLEIVKEFLFIDDHSNDNSVTIISSWIDKNKIKYTKLRLFNLFKRNIKDLSEVKMLRGFLSAIQKKNL